MRLSELYTSIQGEGPNVGKATQFVRFAGCNYRCALWPCDSPYAIDPKLYRHEWEIISDEDLFYRIISSHVKHLCFTGGEPFMQKSEDLEALVRHLYDEGYTVDYFTNGSFVIPAWIIDSPRSTIVLDYKLPGSGEYNKDSENRFTNVSRMDSRHAIKFTVASQEDLDMASMIWHSIISTDVQIYLGPVWDKMTPARCAEYILERRLPWKLNVQVHKFIWDEKARGI